MSFALGSCNIVGFIPIVDVEKARTFYRDVLGLKHLGDELPYALVFETNGIMLRLGPVKERPSFPGTILGWNVPNAVEAVRTLKRAGVTFERYGFMEQDEDGIWITPTGAKVAWFKDPDGNLLSVSEHPERQ